MCIPLASVLNTWSYHSSFLCSLICCWIFNKVSILWAQIHLSALMTHYCTVLHALPMTGALWKVAGRRESVCGALWHKLFRMEPGQVERRLVGSVQRWDPSSWPGSQWYAHIRIFNCLVLKRGNIYCTGIQQKRTMAFSTQG